MKVFPSIFAILLSFALPYPASGATNDDDDAVLVQLGNASISRFDFEVSYQAWLDQSSAHVTGEAEHFTFLSKLISLKKIALLASHQGLDNKPSYKEELRQHFKHATETGNLYRDVENRKLIEAYHREHYVVNASHILRAVNRSDATEHQAITLKEIEKLKQMLLTGDRTFSEAAILYSDNAFASDNGGSLGYFTVFERLYPLENAAYRTPVGAVSDPVKSRFGYHLLKVHSRTRIEGLKRASHILIRTTTAMGKEQSGLAKKKIEKIYAALTPTNFSEVATRYSEDYESSPKGGDMGVDRLVDALESVKLATTVGSYSKPFRSALGWHILMVTEMRPFKSFAQERERLRNTVNFRSRVQHEVDELVGAGFDKIDSLVLDEYAENVLCGLLLSNSANFPAAGYITRSGLINYLMLTDLPEELSILLSDYQATVNPEVLESILQSR